MTATKPAPDRSPGRRLGTIDNRGGHFYFALDGAQQLAAQDEDVALKAEFAPISEREMEMGSGNIS